MKLKKKCPSERLKTFYLTFLTNPINFILRLYGPALLVLLWDSLYTGWYTVFVTFEQDSNEWSVIYNIWSNEFLSNLNNFGKEVDKKNTKWRKTFMFPDFFSCQIEFFVLIEHIFKIIFVRKYFHETNISFSHVYKKNCCPFIPNMKMKTDS